MNLPEDGPQLPTQACIHEHVEVLPVFECLVELDYEVTVRLLHDLLLRHDVLLLTRLNNLKKQTNKKITISFEKMGVCSVQGCLSFKHLLIANHIKHFLIANHISQ